MATRQAGKSRLGRGLSSLITPATPATDDEGGAREYFLCPIDAVLPMEAQPRQHFDEERLRELADSIQESGIIQPLVVRAEGDTAFRLIAGERRLRAAQRAGLDTVPVVVREVSAQAAYALALVENVQREDLNPIEEAEAYLRLIEEHGLTQEKVAEQVGKSRTTITNSLRLLKLGRAVQSLVVEGTVSAGHARAILSVDEKIQSPLAERIVTEGLSVRQAEEVARRVRDGASLDALFSEDADPETDADAKKSAGKKNPPTDLRPQLKLVRQKLREQLGARVELQQKSDGSGRIEVHFADTAGLQAIVDRILGDEGML